MMSSVKEQKLQNECILDLATDLRKARAEVERLRSDTGLGWNHRHAELLAATARAEAAEFTVAGLRRALEGLVVRLEEVHNSPEYKSVWCCYMIHGGDYSNGPKYDKVLATAQTALAASPDDHCDELTKRDAQQRREGAAAWLENAVREGGYYERSSDGMLEEAKQLREGKA